MIEMSGHQAHQADNDEVHGANGVGHKDEDENLNSIEDMMEPPQRVEDEAASDPESQLPEDRAYLSHGKAGINNFNHSSLQQMDHVQAQASSFQARASLQNVDDAGEANHLNIHEQQLYSQNKDEEVTPQANNRRMNGAGTNQQLLLTDEQDADQFIMQDNQDKV